MVRKYWGMVLGTALLCILAFIFFPNTTNSSIFSAILFPFVLISRLLREMSLTGGIGNISAIVLYSALALVPLVVLLYKLVRKKARIEDILLPIMSAFFFFAFYYLINPFLLEGILPYDQPPMGLGKHVLYCVFYSLLTGYFILRLLRKLSDSESKDVLTWLQRLLVLGAVIIAFSVFYFGLSRQATTMGELRAVNTDPRVSLGLSNAFIVMRYVLQTLPLLLSLGLFSQAIQLAEALKDNRFGEATVTTATRLGLLSRITVAVTVLSSILANLLQLAFSRRLLLIEFSAVVPIIPFMLALVLLILAQYFAESSELHKENQLFI